MGAEARLQTQKGRAAARRVTALSPDGLRVAIGLPGAVLLVIGGIVGVGIFVNPAVVARAVSNPASLFLAWGAGGLIALLGAFVYAELGVRLPETGGEYVYLRETYGRLAGFLFGWTTLLVVHTGGMAAVAIVFARNLDVILGARHWDAAIAVPLLLGLAALNAAGVRAGNAAQAGLGALKLAIIVGLVATGLALAPHAGPALPHQGQGGFAAAIIPVVFSFGGWQTANFVTGEMRGGGRKLARALLLGVCAVIAIYLLVNLACLRALGMAGLAASTAPLPDMLARVAGGQGARLAAGAVAVSALAYLSQGMLTGPRVLFAMARDGLFFARVARVEAGTRAPAAAILVQAAWTCVLVLFGTYEQILSYVIAMNFLFFGLSASCLFTLRRRDAAYAGPRVPFHPWSTGVFVAACAAVVLLLRGVSAEFGAGLWADGARCAGLLGLGARGPRCVTGSVCDRCLRPGACCRALILSSPFFNAEDPVAAQAAVSAVVTGLDRLSGGALVLSFNHGDAAFLAARYDHVRAGLPFLHAGRDTARARNLWRCPVLDEASGRCTAYEARPALCRHFQPGASDLCAHFADGIGLCAERARPRRPASPASAYAARVAAAMARIHPDHTGAET